MDVFAALIMIAWLLTAAIGFFSVKLLGAHPLLVSSVVWTALFGLLQTELIISPSAPFDQAAEASLGLSLPAFICSFLAWVTRKKKAVS